MIISRTPLRVSFLGGGSDLPSYYRREGGAVLSAAIDKSVYVTVSKKFDDAVRVSYSRTEEVATAADVEHPLVRECLQFLGIEGGIEITSVADIPSKGTGLGSSSAFTVGLLNALHGYQGRSVSAEQLAREACHIEIDRCGEPIGKQDQYASAHGGVSFYRFNPDESVDVEPVDCPEGTLQALQERLLFFYTGVTRSASALLSEQSAQVAQPGARSNDTSALVRMAETGYAQLRSGDLTGFGPLLHEAWLLKRQISTGVTTPFIDDAYAAAMAAGAEGGKILGAGGGGFLMFVAPPQTHDAIRQGLSALRETPFRIGARESTLFSVPSFGPATSLDLHV